MSILDDIRSGKGLPPISPIDEMGVSRSLCDSCINNRCIFQSEIVRNHCNFYKVGRANRKKGKWIYGENDGQNGWLCSKCDFCDGLESGDKLFQISDWDGGIGFDYIYIKYCPMCGRRL